MTGPSPRDTSLFDAGARWATEPTDQRGYGDALRDAVERATTPSDGDCGRELAQLAAAWDENATEERRAMGRPTVSVDEAVSSPYVADTWEQAASELRAALAASADTEAGATAGVCGECGAVERLDVRPSGGQVIEVHVELEDGAPVGTCGASSTERFAPLYLAATPADPAGAAEVTELGRALRARMDELGLPDYADVVGFERHVRNGEGARVGAYVAEWIPGTPWATPATAGPPAEGAAETEVRRVLADRGYHGDDEPVAVLLARTLNELGARSTDPYGTGDGSYPEPRSEDAGDRTVNDPPGFVAAWCPDCSTVGGHDIDCPHAAGPEELQRRINDAHRRLAELTRGSDDEDAARGGSS